MLSEYGRELVREIVQEVQKMVTAHMQSVDKVGKEYYKTIAMKAYERINGIAKILNKREECSSSTLKTHMETYMIEPKELVAEVATEELQSVNNSPLPEDTKKTKITRSRRKSKENGQ